MSDQGFKQIKSGIEQDLESMVKRGRSVSAYMNRTLFRKFQEAQVQRWETQGASEGTPWKPLSPRYAQWKRKHFASAPGGGSAMMVRTGNLEMGAMGRNSSYFYKVVDDRSFIVGINLGSLPYAKYPGKVRPFMAFADRTEREWHKGIREYIVKGVG